MVEQSVLMVGVGSYLPNKVVTNEALSKIIDTSDTWIRRRTGIAQRHIVAEGETTSNLAYEASKAALRNASFTGSDIDLIIVATTTPDNTFPSTAAKLQHDIEANGCIAFDIQAVCAGFVYAIDVAEAMLRAGRGRRALVVGAESFSKILDWKDRSTCVLFGDGAGAVILELAEKNAQNWGIRSSVLHSDGAYRDILYVDGGPSINNLVGHVRMEGKEVFKHAVEKLSTSLKEALILSNKKINEIDWLVPHQANQRIILAVADKMNIDVSKVISTVKDHGNTSAASIPLALDKAMSLKKILNGNLIGINAIGGGLSWGASIIRIGKPKFL